MAGKRIILFASLIFIVLSLFFVLAISSTNYNLSSYAVSSGGSNASSSNYKNNEVVGTIAGNSSSSSYKNYIGFFYSAYFDSTAPQIDFGTLTLDTLTRTWNTNIYADASIVELNPKNITFKLYNSTGAVNSTTYSMSNVSLNNSVNWTSLSGDDYTYNVTSCDTSSNCNTTSTRTITIITSQTNITLNSGWNLIALNLSSQEDGDVNISLSAGWNLIGYSSDSALGIGSSELSNSTNSNVVWSSAILTNMTQAYAAYYDSSQASGSRQYKYVAPYSFAVDGTALSQGKGYWVRVSKAGNLTLPGVGGSKSGATYPWSKLRFFNGTDELNITSAGSERWISTTLQYRQPGAEDYSTICESILPPTSCTKTTISPWEGIFVYSNKDNITLVRQN